MVHTWPQRGMQGKRDAHSETGQRAQNNLSSVMKPAARGGSTHEKQSMSILISYRKQAFGVRLLDQAEAKEIFRSVY